MHIINRNVFHEKWIETIPEMTIVTSCFDKAKCIKYHIDLLRKSFIKNHKIILIDDKSRDDTRKIIKSLEVDKVLFNEKRMGWGECNNQALKLVDTEIVVFMDADFMVGTFGWLENWYSLYGKEDFGEAGEIHHNPGVYKLRNFKDWILTRPWLSLNNTYTNEVKKINNHISIIGHIGGNYKIMKTETIKSLCGFENDFDPPRVEVGTSMKLKAFGKKMLSYLIPYRYTILRGEMEMQAYETMIKKLEIQKALYYETRALLVSTFNFYTPIIYQGNLGYITSEV